MRNDIIKISFGLFIGIFAALQFKSCNKLNNDSNVTGVSFGVETITKIDTVIISKIDTFYVKEKTKIIIQDSVQYVGIVNDSVSEYQTEYNEKDLKATLFTKSTGSVLSQKLKYSVICPIINKLDSIFIFKKDSTTVTKQHKKHQFFVGAETGWTDQGILDPAANLTWKWKNDYMIYYEYKLSLNKNLIPDQHRFGIKIPLRLK